MDDQWFSVGEEPLGQITDIHDDSDLVYMQPLLFTDSEKVKLPAIDASRHMESYPLSKPMSHNSMQAGLMESLPAI